jgi:hypothetical protein
MLARMLSIIISSHNEASNSFFIEALKNIQKNQLLEVIIVDFKSKDGTLEIIKSAQIENPNIKLIETQLNSRAARLNLGIKEARFEMVLLNHPRSIIEIAGLNYLLLNAQKLNWGGFTHSFDMSHPLLKFTSWYSNHIRADRRSIFYLDHCIFAKKKLLEMVSFLPAIDIFEDTEISLRLRTQMPGIRLPFIAKTSAVRFHKNGMLKQALLNQYLKISYFFKRDHKKMNSNYEKGLDLNSEYNRDKNGL